MGGASIGKTFSWILAVTVLVNYHAAHVTPLTVVQRGKYFSLLIGYSYSLSSDLWGLPSMVDKYIS